MNCHIVYLKPVGAGGYKADLRSDTLWGALCWAIRALYGDEALTKVLASYSSEDKADAFFLSSAFPWAEEDGDKVCFFPSPFLPMKQAEVLLDVETMTPNEVKNAVRRQKKVQKRISSFISRSHFEYIINGSSRTFPPKSSPTIINRPMTHNTIDRLKGSTLTLNDSGQLFHTEEKFIEGEHSGLFFLLKGNMEYVTPALRFLENEGIGGDRSNGKGRFEISAPEAFEIKTPEDANALVTLSVYHPAPNDLALWRQGDERLLNYRIEERLGRTQLQRQYLHDRVFMGFKEGSVFPGLNSSAFYGQNKITGKHSADFDIHRYGFGFMVEAKIS